MTRSYNSVGLSTVARNLIRTGLAIGTLAVLGMLAGCDSASKNSTGDPGDSTTTASPKAATPDGTLAEGRDASATPTLKEGTTTPNGSGSPSGTAPGVATTLDKPPALAADALNEHRIPENGSPTEILEFCARLDGAIRDTVREAQLSNMTQEQLEAKLTKWIELKKQAAEKVLTLPEATVEQRETAVRLQVESLTVLTNINSARMAELRKLAESLINNEVKAIANQGRLTLFMLDVDQYANGQQTDRATLDASFQNILANEDISPDEFKALCRGVSVLYQTVHREVGEDYLKQLAEKFGASKNEELAKSAQQLGRELQVLGFEQYVFDAMQRKPGSVKTLIDAAQTLVAADVAGERFQEFSRYASNLEFSGNLEAAKPMYELMRKAYLEHKNEQLAERAKRMLNNVDRRFGLVGKPMQLQGVGVDGSPFNWADYKGKVVLLDFWATWCGPCLAEVPNLKENYAIYNPHGFEIVGINLDDDPQAAAKYLQANPLPWKTIVSADPKATGFANSIAVQAGVEAIPFLVLIGQDGTVQMLHVRGEQLGEELAKRFPNAATKKTPAAPVPGQAPAGQAPTGQAPTGQAPTGQAPGKAPTSGQTGAAKPSFVIEQPDTFFVSFDDDDAVAEREGAETATPTAGDTPPESKEEDPLSVSGNPYLPRQDLSAFELIEFLLDMREKPKSIQRRPGFTEAVVAAAERVLKTSRKEKFQVIAVLEKFRALHADACLGDEETDKQLVAFLKEMEEDDRKKIAEEVAFLRLEREVLDADEIELAQVSGLLSRLADYYAARELGERHLRIASSTIHAINRLEDGAEREKYFKQFGTVFAKSAHKPLSRYGKKLAKAKASGNSDLVGKPLELAGTTLAGNPFNWDAYRGKVVLVDFWATWCAPCRQAMPQVKALHEKLQSRGFEVVGVSLDQDQTALADYVDENQIAWENLIGEDAQKLAGKYGVRGIPSMFLVDSTGKIVAVSHQLADLSAQIEKLIEAANPAGKG